MERLQSSKETALIEYFKKIGYQLFKIKSDTESIWLYHPLQKYQWVRFSEHPFNAQEEEIILEKLKKHPKYEPSSKPVLNIVVAQGQILIPTSSRVVYSTLEDQYANLMRVKNQATLTNSNKSILILMLTIISMISIMALSKNMSSITVNSLGLSFNALSQQQEYWRLITYSLIHGDMIHLLLNMFSLWILGQFIFEVFDRNKALAAYFIGAIFSGMFVVTMQHNVLLIGSSGALYAWFGLMLYFTIKNNKQLPKQFVQSMIFIIAVNILISLQPGISGLGHISGFVIGYLIAPYASIVEDKNKRTYSLALVFLLTFLLSIFISTL